MYGERLALYRQLEAERGSRVIALINGDRPGLETQLHADVLDYLIHHLDRIGVVPRISLYLYTRGGQTLAAWSIVNLLRQFCEELEVIVPAKAWSAGTLICLGADAIVMTKQATLGPIDPSVNGALNPIVETDPRSRVSVGVEEINGFVEFVRAALGTSEGCMIAALRHLAGQIHPLVLGGAYRSRMQIRMLAKRLVGRQIRDAAKLEGLLNFLCSDSGSHDYTIFRREAREDLGLRVTTPGESGYRTVKSLFDDVQAELELRTPFDPGVLLGIEETASYQTPIGLLESVSGGCHAHLAIGTFQRVRSHPTLRRTVVQDDRTFEGWRHVV